MVDQNHLAILFAHSLPPGKVEGWGAREPWWVGREGGSPLVFPKGLREPGGVVIEAHNQFDEK